MGCPRNPVELLEYIVNLPVKVEACETPTGWVVRVRPCDEEAGWWATFDAGGAAALVGVCEEIVERLPFLGATLGRFGLLVRAAIVHCESARRQNGEVVH
jgi:hypothetical protein